MSRVRWLKSVLLLFFLASVAEVVSAQQPLQFIELEQQFRQGRLTPNEVADKYITLVNDGVFQRCGTPAYKFFSEHQAEIDERLLQETAIFGEQSKKKAQSYQFISATGKFKVFYEKEGSDAVPPEDLNGNSVPDYVEWVAEAMDSSYRHEVLTLGFTDPVPAGEAYEVYLENIGSVYGLTHKSASAPGGTYIRLHKDFIGFPANDDPDSHQRGSIRVTAAHEFKHAIQYAQNKWKGEADRWSEMDATLMEEVVFDQVNDYYHYIRNSGSVFRSPEQSVIPGSYQHITWALYFYERFGPQFWPRVWQRIEADPDNTEFLVAIFDELNAMGENYSTAVAENYLWHFSSGADLSPPRFGFDERLDYPAPFIRKTLTTLSDSLSESNLINRYAAHFYLVNLDIATGGKVRAKFNYPNADLQFGFIAYFNNGSTQSRLITGSSTGQSNLSIPWNWYDIEKLGIVVVNTNPQSSGSYQYAVFTEIPEEISLSQNYPNPFNPATLISYDLSERRQVTLEVYDYTGRLLTTLVNEIQQAGSYEVQFDGAGLASGMYLYRLKAGTEILTKKMMLIK